VRLRASALLLTALIVWHEAAAQSAVPPGVPLSRAEVSTAVEQLRKDPNLGGERKIRSLRWTGSKRHQSPRMRRRGLLVCLSFSGSQAARCCGWRAPSVLGLPRFGCFES
jgi:hypothetical protein